MIPPTIAVIPNAMLSSGTTTGEQQFDFTDVSARWVRYLGHGNTVNMWNSVTEVSARSQQSSSRSAAAASASAASTVSSSG